MIPPAPAYTGTVPPIRVALVEDQGRTREGLTALIDGSPGFQVSGAFPTMEEALPAIEATAPDIVLVDIGLPGMSGIEGVQRLNRSRPDLPILILTIHTDDDSVFAAICAGASGYLLKETEPYRLLECLQELHTGGAPMSPAIARRVVTEFRQRPSQAHPEIDLSPRQISILQLLAQGHSYKSCADALDLSLDTIRHHVRKIYDRLHVHSRSEAVWKAVTTGLVRAGRL